jgi:molybdopterin-guanine dinucleotide biosynthesis protein A
VATVESAPNPPPIPGHGVAGLVLSGGRSSRFGGEKAAALLAGRPLLAWAVERLRASCALVAVSARPGSEAETLAGGLPVLHDRPDDPDGPLAGVRAGLAWARRIGAGALAVSPCDAPLLPDGLYPRLIAAAGEGGAAAAETVDGVQPLCAVWPVSALHRVEAAIAGGAHPPVRRLLEELGAARVRFDDAAAFANLNTREDLARIAASHPQAAKR